MNINIVPNGAIKRVHVSQNDIGRTLTFNLFNDSLAYTVPTGATVKIQGTKPSGFGFSETCTVSGNTVTIDTTEAMTDEFGYIEAELQITNSGDVLGTSNFILAVERNPHPSNTTDGTQITAQSLQSQIDDLRDEIESGGSGLTDDIKQALLNCFAHVAWIDEDGQDYYDALESALYPPANLTSISCVYTQSGTVYDTDSLDSLKSDLVVTAHYDDSSTRTVTTYTLSGTLTEGTSTITVLYGGQTTTFDVTVTQATVQYTITNNLTDCTNSNSNTTINELSSYVGTLTAISGYVMSDVTVTMGNSDITSSVYDSSTGEITISSVTGNIVITAVAIEDVGWISGVSYDMSDIIDNYYLSNGVETSYTGWAISPYLNCYGAYLTSDKSFNANYGAEYDNTDTFIGKIGFTANSTPFSLEDYGVHKIRVSASKGDVVGATITPYRFPSLEDDTVWVSDQWYVAPLTYQGYIGSSGDLVTHADYKTSDYCNCYNVATITDNIDSATKAQRSYAFYDGNKTFISIVEYGGTSTDNVTTVPSNARYFRLTKRIPNRGVCFKLA